MMPFMSIFLLEPHFYAGPRRACSLQRQPHSEPARSEAIRSRSKIHLASSWASPFISPLD
ncbi:hypothetical protein TSAR_016536 [Trichomalopsis sarcophagae]|uniref:Uncharacterized protein n=1 Tax=Trichomalopsis sarcophagae TaxID=543379 RepID=A0A232EDD5_9HYME|nr:hypothetical protein TSAR_016536 [Trichomalopsis sarcophagae]